MVRKCRPHRGRVLIPQRSTSLDIRKQERYGTCRQCGMLSLCDHRRGHLHVRKILRHVATGDKPFSQEARVHALDAARIDGTGEFGNLLVREECERGVLGLIRGGVVQVRDAPWKEQD